MSKHTPGPWEMNPTQDVGYWFIGTADKPVAECVQLDKLCGLTRKESRANARLIAAAPDLLEALKALLPMIHTINDNGEAIDAAEAAIEKAEGR